MSTHNIYYTYHKEVIKTWTQLNAKNVESTSTKNNSGAQRKKPVMLAEPQTNLNIMLIGTPQMGASAPADTPCK